MRAGEVYRHKRCLDMDIMVTKIQYRGPTYFKAKVLFINRHNGNLLWESAVTVKIERSELRNWEHISNRDLR